MVERFSRQAAAAVSLAGADAHRLGHDHIGTEHLLIGLLAEGTNPAARALTAAGASLVSVREKVTEALASRAGQTPPRAGQDLPLTDRANRVLDRAGRLSLRQGHDQVGCEHILASLIDVEGTAGQVLRGIGVDPDRVKGLLQAGPPAPAPTDPPPASSSAATLPGAGADAPADPGPAVADASPSTAATPPDGDPPTVPLCATCGAELRTALGHTRLAAGPEPDAPAVEVYYCRTCGAALGVHRL